MRSPHILLLRKNIGDLKKELSGVVSRNSIRAIDLEVRRNVAQLFTLGNSHFEFARNISSGHWRQIISRSYYAAYVSSRALRLAVKGEYSQETKDHDKVGELPDDFHDRNTYANRFKLLRDDRNLCDYDHTATELDLVFTVEETLELIEGLWLMSGSIF